MSWHHQRETHYNMKMRGVTFDSSEGATIAYNSAL